MRRILLISLLAACEGGAITVDDTDTDGGSDTDTDTDTDGGGGSAAVLEDEGCDDTRDAAVFDPFPEDAAFYTGGTAARFSWPGEDFESFSAGQLVEDDTDRDKQDHLDVVAGSLSVKAPTGPKRGWSDDGRMVALAIPTDGGRPVAWTDAAISAEAYVKAWAPGSEDWANVGLIVRYQTDDDFYFAGLRKSGVAILQRKHCGVIETLATATFGTTNLEQWYDLELSAEGDQLTFSIDGSVVVEATDDTLSWGVAGVLQRDAEVFHDGWRVGMP